MKTLEKLSLVRATNNLYTTLRHSPSNYKFTSSLFSSQILKMAAGMATREIKTRRVELFPFAHKIIRMWSDGEGCDSVWSSLFNYFTHFPGWPPFLSVMGYDIIHCEFYIIISHIFILKNQDLTRTLKSSNNLKTWISMSNLGLGVKIERGRGGVSICAV